MSDRPQDLANAVRTCGLADFEAARRRMAHEVLRTPLLPFQADAGRTVRIKAENLQPFGSFKLRCAANVLSARRGEPLRRVATASAGNFAQGLALAARRRNIELTVHVPESAAGVKLEAVRQLGATIVRHPFPAWWQIMMTRQTGADDGLFIHPVCEPDVIVGNGTIGLELAEDWPEMDTVIVPFGGGGLICGIALALRACGKAARVIACEVQTSTPLAAARKAGRPVQVERAPSFVDGIGSNGVLTQMWPLLQDLVDDVIVVGLKEVSMALRALAKSNHLIAEGAGAAALAAALSGEYSGRNVVAVVSGGNIDFPVLAQLLSAPDSY